MKKLVAFFFLCLISFATISSQLKLWDAGYELAPESDRAELENKEGKKEIKEFTANNHKKIYTKLSFLITYKLRHDLIYPAPILSKQTPPPDQAC